MKWYFRKLRILLVVILPIILLLVSAIPVLAFTQSSQTTVGLGDPNGNDFWGASVVQISEIISQIGINQSGWEDGWDLNVCWNVSNTVYNDWICGVVGNGLYLCFPMPSSATLGAAAYYYLNGSWIPDHSDGNYIRHPFAQ